MRTLESKIIESLVDGELLVIVSLPSGKKAIHTIRKAYQFGDMLDIEKKYMEVGYKIFK